MSDCQFVYVVSLLSTSVVTIGFSGNYDVREAPSNISIAVLVLMNSLARDVVVTLSTLNDTARGKPAQCLPCLDEN